MKLTTRQSEALEVIKTAGATGIKFAELQKRLKIKPRSTLAQRIGELKKIGAITSTVAGKFATYRIVG